MKSLMLESNGKPVRVRCEFPNGYGQDRKLIFSVENGDGTHTVVPEATICQGKNWCWTDDHVAKAFGKAGFDWVSYKWEEPYPRARYSSLKIYAPGLDSHSYHNECWHSAGWVTQEMKHQNKKELAGYPITEDELNRLVELVEDIEGWESAADPNAWWKCFGGKKKVGIQVVLGFLGEGTVITSESLLLGCPKGETRPRLKISDMVEANGETGIVVSITLTGIVVQKADKKSTYAYNKVQPAKISKKDVPVIEETIKRCLADVLARKHVLYRAKITIKDHISIPLFPTDEEKPIEMNNAETCACPVCGWQMVHMAYSRWSSGKESFTCCVCKQSGTIIASNGQEVILRMSRRPSKNQFAIREVPCCANCGNFSFDSGREGKRSTGYCSSSNLCLQAFNTCEWWFPRDPEEYRSNMRQHVTNLGYGVSDNRNTSRNDIRDTIYRKEDHEAQRVRAEQAMCAYTFAYKQLMDELKAEGEKLPLVEEVDDALKEKYGKELDGGV